MRARLKLGTVAFAAFAALVLACGDPDPQDDADSGFAAPAAVASSAAPSSDGSLGAGTYQVGRDIAAGTWETQAAPDAYGCYWQRSKDATGGFESIIANGNIERGAHGIVQIAATDKFVTLSGSCRWRKTG